MKNKIKKTLATIGLGVVGCASLAGCSLTGDQQANIDKLFDKADDLSTKLEQVLDKQNKQYSEQDIVDKIMLTRLNFTMATYNDVRLLVKMQNYEGYFANSQKEDLPVMMDVYYRYQDNIKVLSANYNDYSEHRIYKKDYNKNIDYSWSIYEDENETVEDFKIIEDKDEKLYWSMSQMDAFNQFMSGYTSITANDIYNIKVDGDKLTFDIVVKVLDEEPSHFSIRKAKVEYDGEYITKLEANMVEYHYSSTEFEKDEQGNVKFDAYGIPVAKDSDLVEMETIKMNAYYEFENIDYTSMDETINLLEAKHLYNKD